MGGALLLGHRGAPEDQTENTLGSFASAIESGADGVELDLRLAADGTVIVFHDADLVRLAGREGGVDALTWAQLHEVELAGGTRIPRLSDLLEVFPVDKWLDIELKAGGDALVDAALEVLDGRDNTFMSSFDPRLLARAREQGWAGSIALLLERQSPAFLHAEGGRDFGADGVILDAQICSAHAAARYRDMGYALGVYGGRDPVHEQRLLSLGLTWLITDWPRNI
jgi:glycerophosphoryl diester phosphodiesterase